MTFTYLHVRKIDPSDWIAKFFEIRDDNRVSRMVTVNFQGNAESNSVAIMAHSHSAFADIVHGDEGPCIVGGFPAPGAYTDYWSQAGCAFEVIQAKEFQRRFMRARPKL